MSYQIPTSQSRTMSHSNYGGSDVPMAPSKEQQTLMWQQNSYLVDSGINSGAATQVPSLTGKEDDEMEGDQLMFDLDQGFAQGFTQEQVDAVVSDTVSACPCGNVSRNIGRRH
ncbi:unnamed protein product [Leptidea sinapis]|uniref:Uncharacterized protein n=1 Tax=Leptidea sinapis TaxID=189913 RepID=A0A5E4QBR4_9NEOP|nr:unnamed protein product [Leptidea sinapis]